MIWKNVFIRIDNGYGIDWDVHQSVSSSWARCIAGHLISLTNMKWAGQSINSMCIFSVSFLFFFLVPPETGCLNLWRVKPTTNTHWTVTWGRNQSCVMWLKSCVYLVLNTLSASLKFLIPTPFLNIFCCGCMGMFLVS